MSYKKEPCGKINVPPFRSEEYILWIRRSLTPSFMKKLEIRAEKHFTEDLTLAESARKHSEHMAVSREISHAPLHFLDGSVEEVFACCGKNIEEILWNIAIRSSTSKNIRRYSRIGVGIAVTKDYFERNYVVYLTQRLKPN